MFCLFVVLYFPPDTGSGSEGSGSGTVEGSGSGTVGHKAGSIKRQNSEKGPRVRTVLTEQQLQTLRNVYAANPRPDALLKEHLVERTGLSSRVIRGLVPEQALQGQEESHTAS